jgi:signal transduction histidine kinase
MSARSPRPLDLRREMERLDRLPIRPSSARAVLEAHALDGNDPSGETPPVSPSSFALDPGWSLAKLRGESDPLGIVAGCSWWRVPTPSAAEAIGRLWRNAVAVSIAARRLAREANDPDPDAVARAGLLHRLGLWAVASIDPDRLVTWLATSDASGRRDLEREWIGTDIDAFGQALSDRWGCDPLVGDAVWLFADASGELSACAEDPMRLGFIQQAHLQAEQTPWSLAPAPGREPGPLAPRIRLLMAEVQSRCGGEFVETDATAREERLTRENAALRIETKSLRNGHAIRDRLIAALADSDSSDRPEVWAERAGLAWCDTPGVATARVVWVDPTSATETPTVPFAGAGSRPATRILPLGSHGRREAEIHLWEVEPPTPDQPVVAAWEAWSALVGDRARLRRKLDAVVDAFRRRSEGEETVRRLAKLDALGEFAAGAGHELNNPLAVILGRAQLLLPRTGDPESLRSLRAIIVQAQRAHRILRDLMYVARPAEPNPRVCSADEILRASIRDAQSEAEARGVRIVGDPRPAASIKVWADPDPLRHVADILIRNAIEATPAGGTISVGSSGDDRTIRWTVKDTGRGLSAHEAAHLFDPFFCGRQAGRGLGLGLPRAARIVERAGGELTWQSAPGQGSSFQLKFPVASVPPSPVAGDINAITHVNSTRPVDRAKSA